MGILLTFRAEKGYIPYCFSRSARIGAGSGAASAGPKSRVFPWKSEKRVPRKSATGTSGRFWLFSGHFPRRYRLSAVFRGFFLFFRGPSKNPN
jgi:hypothetical protein